MTRLGSNNTSSVVLFGLFALATAGCPRPDFNFGGFAGRGPHTGAAGSAGSGSTAARCGSRGLPACDDDEFCSFPAEASCGDTDQPGFCSPKPQVCTQEYAPVCGCDGETYGNACSARAAGVSVRAKGECATTGEQDCGGLLGKACPSTHYCSFAPDAFCGAADATGTCQPKPNACTRIYKPVCGCDDKTYGNECEAHAAGVSVVSEGECKSTGDKSCGGLLGEQCPTGEYCDYPPDAICGAADAPGVCRTRADVCTLELAEVCGCDGKTYGNACEASRAGAAVAHKGACEDTKANCGGIAGLTCDDDQYCDFPIATRCGSGDQFGQCADKPTACTKELREMCGCDGRTYGNPCMAAAAGVSIAHEGACETSSGSGKTCGGLQGAQCPKGEYCDFPESAQCGAADQTGTCKTIPSVCTADYTPVCGCDDKTYGNACAAHASGVSTAHQGEC